MQWVKMHRSLQNSSSCNSRKSSTRTLCRLLISLSVNEHCSYQCKNLSSHIKSCRSYSANPFFSKTMKFEHVLLMILTERFWLMMYADFSLFRTVDLKCLEVFNKKWESTSKRSSLRTFSSEDTRLFRSARQSARSLSIWLDIFKSIWRKEPFNKHLMICINWSFRRICLTGLRWLNDRTAFLKKRCLSSSNKTLTFHRTSYSCMMLSKCIPMWKFGNFFVSSFWTSFKVEAYDGSSWLDWEAWSSTAKSSERELTDVVKTELCLKWEKISTCLLIVFLFLLVDFEFWAAFIKPKNNCLTSRIWLLNSSRSWVNKCNDDINALLFASFANANTVISSSELNLWRRSKNVTFNRFLKVSRKWCSLNQQRSIIGITIETRPHSLILQELMWTAEDWMRAHSDENGKSWNNVVNSVAARVVRILI